MPLIPFLGGLLCLPATYWSTRSGPIEISIVVIAALAAFSAWLTMRYEATQRKWWSAAGAFTAGAACAEGVFFTYYYFSFGYNDPKLSVGIAVSLIEFAATAGLGSIIIRSVFFAVQRLRLHRSS